MTYKEFLTKSYNRLRYEIGKLKPMYYKSFSQCGEDMIAGFYLPQRKGFYVDIGAYHPRKISNTCFFYLKGWNGINVDGSKKSIELFKKTRPNDINLHCCVGMADQIADIDFYMFKRAELNTLNKQALPDILKYHGQVPIAIEKISLRSMKSILDEYMPADTKIDLLSIDAEGADEEILLSNDWNRYRPKLLIVEKHCSIYDFIKSDMHQLLVANGYTLGGYSMHSYIFHDLNYHEF